MGVWKIALNEGLRFREDDVLPILYCLSADSLIDFYFLATLKVACKDIFLYSEKINTFGDELDIVVTKQKLLNVTAIKNSYT